MRQLIKSFLWIGLLASCLQTASAFSLLGPVNFGDDSWQASSIGYNPLGSDSWPPHIVDTGPYGPKNLGEGYRRNTPVMYYTIDPSFGNYFGSNGEYAVQQAFDMMNTLSNVDNYSANLSEFPLNSQSENYTAYGLGLWDVKSVTLALLMEQLGLTDAIRYTWTLHARITPWPTGCSGACPACLAYLVVMRNFDFYLTPLGYNPPDWGQYSPYVNGELYTYLITEHCIAPDPLADAGELPADPINNNPPVASGLGEGALRNGFFYTGLTRDDMAGLRWLYSSNNFDTPSAGYMESSAAGSLALSGGGSGSSSPSQLTTFSLAILSFMDPATLQTNVPGIVITSVTTNIVNGQTNYSYTFANLVVYSSSTNTTVITQVQTITISPYPLYGQSYPPVLFRTYPPTTTTTTNTSSMLPGDFYIIPTNSCGLTVLAPLSNIVVAVTNILGTVTNSVGFTTNIISTSVVTFSTNHVLSVIICNVSTNGTTNSSSVVGNLQGIGRVQFVRVSDGNYNYLTKQFYNPVTNQYSMVVTRNGQASTVTFQRVVTAPDFVFAAKDMELGSGGAYWHNVGYYRTDLNFNESNIGTVPGPGGTSLAGPGTIEPTTSTITYNKVGPDFGNIQSSYLSGPDTAYSRYFIWGSFDGTTNVPVIYPNGTSIANLSAEALIQISPPPPALPDGTNAVAYSVTLSATGGQSPYTWSLTANSAGLPPGLTLSPGGVISGTPTSSAIYDNIAIQMNDSSGRSVIMNYSITIH
jgi:hypothetical protein